MNKKTPMETDLQKKKSEKPNQMPNWSVLHLSNRHFAILDVLLLSLAPVLALTLRVNLPWEKDYSQALFVFICLALLVKLPIFFGFRLYARFWRYASMDEMITILLAVFITTALVTAISWGMQGLGVFG